MWIVMTSAAKMPSSCWGRYRNVALVKLSQEYTSHGYRPKMISECAEGVVYVQHMGHHSVGKTARSAYARALADAERLAFTYNNSHLVAHGDLLITHGSA